MQPRMCNVFFALRPDAAANQQADQLLQQMRREHGALGQPVEVERRHVTLRDIGGFFDQMPRAHFANAKAAAATVRVEPFPIAFDQLHCAKGHMFLRPSDGAPGLDLLHRKLNEALIGAGLRRWLTWNFRPHMTLCYQAGAIPERCIEPVTWTVRTFVL
ncbi:MAG: 2'-5' RNA ligase family protein, partial [Rhodospirillaceae bacterium]|nr:2'-5' RNA ligase family protein [Rhodospirillaceae bacterium]